MNVLVDTNVIIDVICRRDPFFEDSYNALIKCIDIGTIYVPASTCSDIYYIVRKYIGSDGAKESIRSLLKFSTIVDTTSIDVINALSSNIKDYEDAIIDQIASRLEMDYILTRNIKDFIHSNVSSITPSDIITL